ncbi:hypothetical protein [Sphingobacterium mizutaii]|uniref:hypothetical protein n=1 Tax=Sphingobacterium mizutaii TaxID=1010 RepID=UPI003D99E6E1
MLSEDYPIKRDDLLKDIPDNKAFYPCADDGAKSHLKWAEALRIRVVFGIRELLRRFGYFWASKVTKRIGIPELLRRFWILLRFKSNKESKFYFLLT